MKLLCYSSSTIDFCTDSGALRYTHQQAWTRLFRDQPDIFEPSIKGETDILARRVLCELSAIIGRSRISGWIRHTNSGIARFDALVELFRRAIWLKHMLRLSEHCYELYFPTESEV
jgi:hypothetical protein